MICSQNVDIFFKYVDLKTWLIRIGTRDIFPVFFQDFGIKYNMENGGPAPESVTNQIFIHTTTIKEYFIAEDLPEVQVFLFH